jgi:hypothetical protein
MQELERTLLAWSTRQEHRILFPGFDQVKSEGSKSYYWHLEQQKAKIEVSQ